MSDVMQLNCYITPVARALMPLAAVGEGRCRLPSQISALKPHPRLNLAPCRRDYPVNHTKTGLLETSHDRTPRHRIIRLRRPDHRGRDRTCRLRGGARLWWRDRQDPGPGPARELRGLRGDPVGSRNQDLRRLSQPRILISTTV